MNSARERDITVVGGGLVGMAIGCGLARLGREVTVFDEGDVQIGASKEDVGFDNRTDSIVVGRIARRAACLFPVLEQVRVVRRWGALRIMSPDGHPVYDRSISHSGASLVTCHSGVTLAAATGEDGPDYLEVFSGQRFAVQAA